MLTYKGFDILGIDFEKRASKAPKTNSPVVYMSNHQNNVDLLAGGANFAPRTILLGKKSLLFIPLFGQFFALSGNFLINRANPTAAKNSMKKLTKKILSDRVSVWIMPEGTRSKGRGLLPFKKGGFITAINCQIPIVPVVFSSYSKTLNFSQKCSGKIISKVLQPIQTKGMTLENLDELMEKTQNLFKTTIEELDNEISGIKTKLHT
jgi:1-acyl-sn-glycerol-3-phosphate acyltransferase